MGLTSSVEGRLSRRPTSEFSDALVGWFREHARGLPWRGSKDPYKIWVSEVMLQQTRVATVLGYYGRWMEVLPSIRSLAEVDAQKLLKLWEGLGYYSRARNLQKAARIIESEHGGRFPGEFDDIKKLPGIGVYTAGAVASLAFGLPHPAVDGNAERVLCRYFGLGTPLEALRSEGRLQAIAKNLLPKNNPGVFNEALIELGATVCVPKRPACHLCPVRSGCEAFLLGTASNLPRRIRPNKTIKRRTWSVVLQHRGRYFLAKRSKKTLMEGLWEFPTFELGSAQDPTTEQLQVAFEEAYGYAIANVEALFEVRHAYTKYRVVMGVFRAELASEGAKCSATKTCEGRWLFPSELQNKPLNAASLKTLKQLSQQKTSFGRAGFFAV